jgi:hypothetical protein
MKQKGKTRLLIILVCMCLIFTLTTASKIQDQDNIDFLCKNVGICEGYNYSRLEAKSGGDMFVTDFRFLRLPKGASFTTSIPVCSIYEYDANEDDDAGWQCLWEQESNGYRFRLTSLNGRDQNRVTIKAVAFILDTNVFKINDNWVFSTSSSASKYLSKPHPKNSVTLITVDSYETNGDDDFNFRVYELDDSYHANTSRGNKGSYITGRMMNFTLPSTMFSCQDSIQLQNNTVYWDSRLEGCGNLKYSKQFPLIVPSITYYYFKNDNVDKDFGIINNFFGLHPDSKQTWADLSTKITHGNKDSAAVIKMTILGYR